MIAHTILRIATTVASIAIASSAAATSLQDAHCGQQLTTLNQYLFVKSVDGATAYRVVVTDKSNQAHTLLLNQHLHNPFFALSQQGWAKYEQFYHIKAQALVAGVWQNFGAACTVQTPELPELRLTDTFCNQHIDSFWEYVEAIPVPGAQRYGFRITDGNGLNAEVYSPSTMPDKPVASIAHHGVFYDRTYTIQIRVKVGGSWSRYGAGCEVHTPTMEYPQVDETYCNSTLRSMDQLFDVHRIQMSDQHVVEISSSDGYYCLDTVPGCPPPPWYSFGKLRGINYGTEYSVRISAKYDGITRDFGPTCIVRTPDAPPTVWQRLGIEPPEYQAKPRFDWANSEFELALYPNPVSEVVNVQLKGDYYHELPATIHCFDAQGTLLHIEKQLITPAGLQLTFPAHVRFVPGWYLLEMQIGDRYFRQKFLKVAE